MIWAILIWYFMGGAAGLGGAALTSTQVADLEGRVVAVVAERDRQQRAGRLLKDLRKDLKRYEKAYSKSGKELAALYLRHTDNRDEALAVLEGVNTDWRAAQERALDAFFALRIDLTADEWPALLEQ